MRSQCLKWRRGECAERAQGQPANVGTSGFLAGGMTYKFLEADPHLQVAQPQQRQHSCCPCHPDPRHRLMTEISSVQDCRQQLPMHLVSATSWQPSNAAQHTGARAQISTAHRDSIHAFEPEPVITPTDSSSSHEGPPKHFNSPWTNRHLFYSQMISFFSVGGLWSVSRFQWRANPARYANLAS